nr:PaaI family thioesterase [Sphingomonas turrisvirgatae]
MAVTNTLTMNFLTACEMRMIVAEARLLKLGRRLAVVDVRIWQDSEDRPVAQATVGYALP